MDRKKELKQQYAQLRQQMGIIMTASKSNKKFYLQTTHDIKGAMNSSMFKLRGGMHPCRELQKEWKELGEAEFTTEILEYLEYDEDVTKTDYSEEIKIINLLWEEKYSKLGYVLYKK